MEQGFSSGRAKIDWAAHHMPILAELKKAFQETKPFAGLTIGICLHIEAKTGVWLNVLNEGGAKILATGSPGSTQFDVADELNRRDGITVCARSSDRFADHLKDCRDVLRGGPHLIADNGADLHSLVAFEPEFNLLKQSIRGATEETTTGGFRLREDFPDFSFPTWVINDTQAKRVIENRYGVGTSVVDGLMRATNILLNGKRVLVVGYGYCGSGIAMRLRGLRARVLVVEKDPLKRLEAHMEGFETGVLEELLPVADIVMTVTGRSGILGPDELSLLKDGALVGNAGHFSTEIDLSYFDQATKSADYRDSVEEYLFADGRKIFLLSGGNPLNLAAGDGNPIEVMDLGLALQSLSLSRLADKSQQTGNGVWPVPRDIETAVANLAIKSWIPRG